MKQFVLTGILLTVFLVSCTTTTASPTIPSSPTARNTSIPVTNSPEPEITAASRLELPDYGDLALAHMKSISDRIGSRPAGTDAEAQTVQYLVKVFEKLRYPSQVQPFTVNVDGNTIQSANVIAIKQGLSSQEIIVGAHYDSVKVGQGADDNASGVGVLLEVADRIKDKETPYSIRFILFGAEEAGLQGSKYYVSQMTQEQGQNTIAMINLDSLTAGDIAYIYGDPGAKGVIRNWALDYAAKNKLPLQTQPGENPKYPAGTTGDWSDHAPFKDAGIPYTYLESTNWTLGDKDGYTQVDPQYGKDGEIWHTQYDTLDYIDATFPGRVQQRLELYVKVLEAVLTEFKLE
jgi:alkaline phosphatase isozyme conversion protein